MTTRVHHHAASPLAARAVHRAATLTALLTVLPLAPAARAAAQVPERAAPTPDTVGQRPAADPEDAWLADWRTRERGTTGLRLTTARTYSRVEGVPIVFGPAWQASGPRGRVLAEAFGIFRTSERTEWNTRTVGHRGRLDVQVGTRSGVGLTGRLYDQVDAVEPWTMSDGEAGLGAFLLQRDFRDYYDRQGGNASLRAFAGSGAASLTVTHGYERWRARGGHEVWSLFRRPEGWRANPAMDDGVLHLTNTTLRLDTRNDVERPASGWLVTADYERGVGELLALGATDPGVRDGAAPGRTEYGRAFLDVRRYNRLSNQVAVHLRVLAAGWLHGDPLPLQRRVSMSGPGLMPGFAFRDPAGATDLGECGTGAGVAGRPAQCDRVVLVQAEYRNKLSLALLDVLGHAPARIGPRGTGRAAHGDFDRWWRVRAEGDLVVFADAGRGWLVGDRPGDGRFARNSIPGTASWRTDVGVGVDFRTIGFYLAKAVTDPDRPAVAFVRVNRRF